MDIFSRTLEVINWPRDKYRDLYLELSKELNATTPYLLFLGAGVSKNIYPDWKQLVNTITSEMDVTLSDEEKDDSIEYALQILERCKTKDETKFYSLLRNKFNPEGKIEHKPLHLDLLTLPFVGFITTNIDVCLLKAASRLPDESKLNGFHYYPDHLPASELKNRKLFHIHGIAINHKNEDTIENTILTETDYNFGYSSIITPFLNSVFNDACVAFIGFSFKDPAIQKILENCKNYQDNLKKLNISRTTKDVNWYIFLDSIYSINRDKRRFQQDEEAEDKQDKSLLDTYNLRVIRYHGMGQSEHTELNKIVNNLVIETQKPKVDGI